MTICWVQMYATFAVIREYFTEIPTDRPQAAGSPGGSFGMGDMDPESACPAPYLVPSIELQWRPRVPQVLG